MLAALTPAEGKPYTPVQVQKLFFLIDRNIPAEIEGPRFSFEPYHYGPFDKNVYEDLERLATEGYVDVDSEGSCKAFRLTVRGQEHGERLFGDLPGKAQDYIRRASEFVRQLPFSRPVASIYRAYPEMRANSVFQD